MIRPFAFVVALAAAIMFSSPIASAQTQDVSFTGSYSAVNLGWDSGWYPPGDDEPGGSVIQVRLVYDAAASADAQINGTMAIEDGLLGPDGASGTWGYDFGASVMMQIAFNFNFSVPNPFGSDFEIGP